MRIVWWNTQRLGGTTDEDRRLGIATTLGQFDPDPDLIVLCELTQQSADPAPINYTYRKRNAFQLCYAVEAGTVAVPACAQYTPNPTNCYKQRRFKGGNDFTKLTSRAPGHMQLPATAKYPVGVHLYFFHAPASNAAVKAIAFLACDLDHVHQNDAWILFGDLNVEPDVLTVQETGIVLADLIKPPDKATFEKTGKKLDYALSNIASLKVTVGEGGGFSDHEPILIAD